MVPEPKVQRPNSNVDKSETMMSARRGEHKNSSPKQINNGFRYAFFLINLNGLYTLHKIHKGERVRLVRHDN